MVGLDKLEPSSLNPNEMSPFKKQLLKKELQTVGFIGAIVVRPSKKKGHYQIIDGEQRWTVSCAAELGMTEIPCIIMDLTDEEASYMIYTLNNLKGEIHPLKLAILLENWRKSATPEDVFHRTGLKAYQQTQIVNRLKPKAKATNPTVLKSQHRTFVAVLNHEEHETVMKALRMTRSSGSEEALLKVCNEFLGCKLRQKIQDEHSKIILKKLDEGKALLEICEHYQSCDDTRMNLKKGIKVNYGMKDERPARSKKK